MSEEKVKKARGPRKSVNETLQALYEAKKKAHRKIETQISALEAKAQILKMDRNQSRDELNKLEKALDIKAPVGEAIEMGKTRGEVRS